MTHTLIQIATALGLTVPERSAYMPLSTLLTDSRSLRRPAESVFFALRTATGDGHRYVRELYDRGVRVFVVERIPEKREEMPDAVWLKVEDTLRALRTVGAINRRNTRRLAAITGSRGKTSLKEWLFQILSPLKSISRSPRSFNSQIGVPLSMWNIAPDTDIALIEVGISKGGEMAPLRDCVRPDTVILTGLGPEHDEGFESREQKLREKLLLASQPPTSLIIYPASLESASRILREEYPGVAAVSWGETGKSVLEVRRVDTDADGCLRVEYDWKGASGVASASAPCKGTFSLPRPEEGDFENACSALAFLLAEGYGGRLLSEKCGGLRHVRTRLNVVEGVNGCSIVADSYTSDFGSLEPAVEFLMRRRAPGQKTTLILSDLLHEVEDSATLCPAITRLVEEAGIDRLVCVGEDLSAHASLLPAGTRFFNTTADLLRSLSPSDFLNELILLKGAAEFGFHRIAEALELKTHETVLEVNLDAIVRNFNYFRSRVRPGTGIVAMVKASGYGAGSLEIAKTLQDCGAAYLAVAVLDEGIDLRTQGITMPVMVMNPKVVNYRQMFEYRLEPEVYSLEMLADVIREAAKYGVKDYPVHLKLDTGMHRMGLVADELHEAARMVNAQEGVEVRSVFSHLATADCLDMDDYTQRQIDRFRDYTATLKRLLKKPFLRHILNSAGILRFPEADFEMVRLGIGLYGVNTLPPEIEAPLAVVSTLRTVIIAIRDWKAGESIGYGRRTVLERDSRIATLPIGYADGMNRHFGCGRIWVLVNGRPAPTAGNICMDACMIDVTGIDCKVGDSVEIFGTSADVGRLAATLDTIPYEVLTSISPRVKRIYYRE